MTDRESLARWVQSPDWRLRYYEAGQQNPRKIILLHGGGPGATGWNNYSQNIAQLAETCHVYAVDMPGWGESSPMDFAKSDHVDALLQFMDALEIGAAAVVGNSMGGHTALRLAAEHGDRVTHLVTMGAPLSTQPSLFGPADGPPEGLKVMFDAYRDPSPDQMRRLVEVMCFDSRTYATPELIQRRVEAAASHPEHLDNVVSSLPRAPIPIWADLDTVDGIDAPTLIIHGRDDRVVPFEAALAMCARIPNARVHLINRCGHWAQVEHAEEFNRVVADFVLHAHK